MSGGYFDYNQYRINDIADQIERVIENNDENRFSQPIIGHMKVALYYLKLASIYTHRIDWLLSGDDGEESFIQRLETDLDQFYNRKSDNEVA